MANSREIMVVDERWTLKHIARHVIQNVEEKAFTVFDVRDVMKKYANWREKMPRVHPFYAVKCNYNKILLELLIACGAGFDCASKLELDLMLSLGAKPTQILFAHTTKPEDHIVHAKDNGVDYMTFDGEFELVKIKHYHPNARLILRIRSDARIAVNVLGNKFGCCPYDEATSLLAIAKQMDLNVVGVSFHVGSLCGEPQAYERAIRESHKLFQMGRKLGHNMFVLDIGGGFPGDVNTSIDEVAREINLSLDRYFPVESGVKVIAEPGRYFTASAFTLVCKVHSARKAYQDDGKKTMMYFLDDGLYGSFAGITSNRLIIDPQPLDLEGVPSIDCSLWGPTCDGVDIVAKNATLPKMPLPSWLLFYSFGAYTSTTSTRFNGFGEAREYAFADESVWENLKSMPRFENDDRLIRVDMPKELPKRLKSVGPDLSSLYASPVRGSAPPRRKLVHRYPSSECHSPLAAALSSPSSIKTGC